MKRETDFRDMRYFSRYPSKMMLAKYKRERRVIVHNGVLPQLTIGLNGFRTWHQPHTQDIAPCSCGWAPELGDHYIPKGWLSGRKGQMRKIKAHVAALYSSPTISVNGSAMPADSPFMRELRRRRR
jgi:hypothetical protein